VYCIHPYVSFPRPVTHDHRSRYIVCAYLPVPNYDMTHTVCLGDVLMYAQQAWRKAHDAPRERSQTKWGPYRWSQRPGRRVEAAACPAVCGAPDLIYIHSTGVATAARQAPDQPTEPMAKSELQKVGPTGAATEAGGTKSPRPRLRMPSARACGQSTTPRQRQIRRAPHKLPRLEAETCTSISPPPLLERRGIKNCGISAGA